MISNHKREPAPDQKDCYGAVEGQFPHEDPETARWHGDDNRFNPPPEQE